MHSARKQFLLLLLLFVHACLPHLTAEPALPEFKNDQERVAYLIYLQQIIPNIFQESARHGGDLLEAVLNQEQIQQRFKNNPRFAELWKLHSEGLMQLNVQVTGNTEVRARVLDPAALQQWRQSLETVVEEAPEGVNLRTYLIEQIRARMGALGNVHADSLRGALLSTLPKATREDLAKRKLTVTELDEYLLKPGNLPKDLRAAGFRPEVFGLANADVTPEKLSELLRKAPALEAELSRLVQVHALSQQADGEFPTRDQALHSLRQLGEGDIDTFVDHDIYMKKLDVVAKDLGLSRDAVARSVGGPTSRTRGKAATDKKAAVPPRTVSQGPMAKAVVSLTSQRIEKVEHLTGNLVLHEVPPHISIFRGCVGGDCSTTNSADVPNAPMERVFFVRNPKGELKGQVSTTIVELPDGKKGLYVHTIAGKRISTADTLTILYGLFEGKEKLGVDEILLIHEGRVAANNNYQAVREGFRIAREGMPVREIKYLDGDIRKDLKAHSYDSPESNKQGYVYTPVVDTDTKIQVDKTTHKLPPFEALPVTKQAVLKFAIDLSAIDEPDERNIQRVLRVLPRENRVTQKDFSNAKSILENRRQLPLDEFYAEVRREFARHGVDVSDDFIEERPFWFLNGHLTSKSVEDPEQFARLPEEQKQRTVDFVIDALTDADRVESDVKTAIKNNREYFQTAPRFLNYLERLASVDAPDEKDLKQLVVLLETGISHPDMAKRLAAIPILVNSTDDDIAKAARSVARSVNGWSEDQKKELARGLWDENPERVTATVEMLKHVGVSDTASQVRVLELHFGAPDSAYPKPAESLGKNTALSAEASEYLGDLPWSRWDRVIPILADHATNDVELFHFLIKSSPRHHDYQFEAAIKRTMDPERGAPPEFRARAIARMVLLMGGTADEREQILKAVAVGQITDDAMVSALWDMVEKEAVEKEAAEKDKPRQFRHYTAERVLQGLPTLGEQTQLRLAQILVSGDVKSSKWDSAQNVLRHIAITSPAAQAAILDAIPTLGEDSKRARGLSDVLPAMKGLSVADQRRIAGFLTDDDSGSVIEALKKSDDPIVLERLTRYALENDRLGGALHQVVEMLKNKKPLPAPVRLLLARALNGSALAPRGRALNFYAALGVDDPKISDRLVQLALAAKYPRNQHDLDRALDATTVFTPASLKAVLDRAKSGRDDQRLAAIEILGHIEPTAEGERILVDAIADTTNKQQAYRYTALQSLRKYTGGHGRIGKLSADGYRRLSALAADDKDRQSYEVARLLAEARSADPAVQHLMLDSYLALKKGDHRRSLSGLTGANPRDPALLARVIDLIAKTSDEGERRAFREFFPSRDRDEKRPPYHIDTLRGLTRVLRGLPRAERRGILEFLRNQNVMDAEISKELATFLGPHQDKEGFAIVLEILGGQKKPNKDLVDAAFSIAHLELGWQESEKLFEVMKKLVEIDPLYQDRLLEIGLEAKPDRLSKIIGVLGDSAWENPAVLARIRANKWDESATREIVRKLESRLKLTENPDTAVTLMEFQYRKGESRNISDQFGNRAVFDDDVYVALIRAARTRRPVSSDEGLKTLKKLLEFARPDVPAVRREIRLAMQSANDDVRILGLDLAASLGSSGKKLRQRIFELADDSLPRVRNAALRALSHHTGLDVAKVGELVERANGRGDTVANELYAKYASRLESGPNTRESLLRQMEEGDEAERSKALEELNKIGKGFSEVQLLRIVARITDPGQNGFLGHRALQILNQYARRMPRSVEQALIDLHKTETGHMKTVIFSTLYTIPKPSPELGAYFRTFALDKNGMEGTYRAMVAWALEKVPDAIAGLEDDLEKMLVDDDLGERIFAARLLIASPAKTASAQRQKLAAFRVLKATYTDPQLQKMPSGGGSTYDRSSEVAAALASASKQFPEEAREYLAHLNSEDARLRDIAERIVAAHPPGGLVTREQRTQVAARLVDVLFGGSNERYSASWTLGGLWDAVPAGTEERILERLATANAQEATVLAYYFSESKHPSAAAHEALLATHERLKREPHSEYARNAVLDAAEAVATPEQVSSPNGRFRRILSGAAQLCVIGMSLLGAGLH